jgi:hypothetical protein
MMPVNPHPLISGVCPLLSLVALAVGFVMMVIAACGFDWARKAAGVCGFGVLLPLVAGVGLLYGKHWRFSALVPVVALSEDGRTCRDGCDLKAADLDSLRAGGYPGYYYRWYAVMITIVVFGKIWEWDEKRGMAKSKALHSARLARQAERMRKR